MYTHCKMVNNLKIFFLTFEMQLSKECNTNIYNVYTGYARVLMKSISNAEYIIDNTQQKTIFSCPIHLFPHLLTNQNKT